LTFWPVEAGNNNGMNKRENPKLMPAAERALAEAKARRIEFERIAAQKAKEVGGRDGPDPARYGDWEKKGIASDFS